MKARKEVLEAALGMGVVVVAALGGDAVAVAPPGDAASLIAGATAELLLAGIFLIVVGAVATTRSVVNNQVAVQFIWLFVAVASLLLFLWGIANYYWLYQRHVLYYKDAEGTVVSRAVISNEMTEFGRAHATDGPHQTPSELLAGVGGIDRVEVIWSRDGISRAKSDLMWAYILLLVSVGMMIFTAVELASMLQKNTSDWVRR